MVLTRPCFLVEWLPSPRFEDPRWSNEDAEKHEEKQHAEECNSHLVMMLIMIMMMVMVKMILRMHVCA